MRPIRATLLLMLTTLLSALFFWYNLEANEAYYFQQSKKTNKEGVPFVLVDNLHHILGLTVQEEENYIYDSNNGNNIQYYQTTSNTTNYRYVLTARLADDTYYLIYEKSNKDTQLFYTFDSSFKLIDKSYYLQESLPLTTDDKTFTQKALKQLTKELLKEINPPLLNLQWIFDWTYTGHRTPKIWLSALILSSGCMTINFTLKKLIRKYDTKN